ncbi:hypothetical protein GIB67_042427 [Kingdonia uniflora]|uniref:histidine--tRNA ligase n=1 Tax=Kingdonia uniflora TaxID=39325 RepID=A0A7J7M8C3_9MAGN|nr:hypothetical protein GIB67_042427 [Kingdonia uniflora]
MQFWARVVFANATHLILHQRLLHLSFLKPSLIKHFSHKTLNPNPFKSLINPKNFSVAQSLNKKASGSRIGALVPPLILEKLEKIDVNSPKGTRDFPPEEMCLRSWIFHNFREVSRLFGFEEVDYPVLESEALFIRKAGEEIRDQCYHNPGVRSVTPASLNLHKCEMIVGFYIVLKIGEIAVLLCGPNLLLWLEWLYKRGIGAAVVSYQWNTDIIGVPGVTAEAELISSIVTFFKRLGITLSDVGFKVSSRKVLQEVLQCYSIPVHLFGKVCVIIDKMEKIPLEEIKTELGSAGVSDKAIVDLLQVMSVKSLSELEGLQHLNLCK